MDDIGLTKRIVGALERAGIRDLHALQALSFDELTKMPGLGPSSVAEIRAILDPDVLPTHVTIRRQIRHLNASLRFHQTRVLELKQQIAKLRAIPA